MKGRWPPIPFVDTHPTQSGWAAFIGTTADATNKGYNSGNTMHTRVSSLQSALNYTVKIVHQTDASGNLLYWGDANGDGVNERTTTNTGLNVYLVTSYGAAPGGANKTIAIEMARTPPITVPSPLYVEATTTIQGSSAFLIGIDQCGSSHKPGLVTTLESGSVTLNGNPSITGVGGAAPNITYNATNMDVQAMIDSIKGSANFSHNVTSDTFTGDQGWGVPTPGETLQYPSSCSLRNVVYINTNGTEVKLHGGVSGCGILLVEGDLRINGGFNWYGIILVSGAITFTGGGDKNITGGALAEASADADLVGGNANIVYCSTAVSSQTQNRPLQILSWADKTM